MAKTGSGIVNLAVNELTAEDIETDNFEATNVVIDNLTLLDLNVENVEAEDVNVSGGVNPQFKSTAAGQTLEMGVASANGNYFSGTTAGDSCIKPSSNLYIGTANSPSFTYLNGVLHFNNQLFRYSKGSWTPTFRYVTNSGTVNPTATITYDFQYGYYTQIGEMVTVFFDIQFTTFNGDAFVNGVKFPAIGNLPITIGVISTAGNIKSSTPLAVGSFPNGMAAGLVPAIGAPVFDGEYNCTAYEQGYAAPLFINQIVNVSNGSWTADGQTLMIYADCSVYTADVTVPPWGVITTTLTPLNNFHITSNLITYPGCRFSGTISYMSDY